MPWARSILLGCVAGSLFVGCQGPAVHVTRYRPKAVAGPSDVSFLIVSRQLVDASGGEPAVVSDTPHAVVAFVGAASIRVAPISDLLDEATRFGLGGSGGEHTARFTGERVSIDGLDFELSDGDLIVVGTDGSGALTPRPPLTIPDHLVEPVFTQFQVVPLADHVRRNSD